MTISLECQTAFSIDDAARVREHVFVREWRLALPRLNEEDSERQLTIVARDEFTQEPVAALTVIETTGDAELHDRLGLCFPAGERAARYTQLAVLEPYRGMNFPIRLILAAQRRFVDPQKIHHTWLLFNAERAKHSSLCNLLGFDVSRDAFLTEYGRSCVLRRDESSPRAAFCDASARAWLNEQGRNVGETPSGFPLPVTICGAQNTISMQGSNI